MILLYNKKTKKKEIISDYRVEYINNDTHKILRRFELPKELRHKQGRYDEIDYYIKMQTKYLTKAKEEVRIRNKLIKFLEILNLKN